MNCWICREHTEKNNLCDCENDYSYVHNHCIEKFVYLSNQTHCRFCKKKYKIRKFVIIINFIVWVFFQVIEFIIFIGEYDLYNCIKWEDYY